MVGVEPTQQMLPEPKSGVYTNSTTSAYVSIRPSCEGSNMEQVTRFDPATASLFLSILLLKVKMVERVMGIEPTRPAWKAGILPLNYTRIYY